jgi:hypothetical protein
MPTHRTRSFFLTSVSTSFVAVLIGCGPNPQPPGVTASAGSGPTTIVDMHGIRTQTTRPPECLTGTGGLPIPILPSAWWQGVSPSVRQQSAVVGYQTWSNSGSPSHCPRDFRTDIYRAFYTVDLSQWAGRSGAVIAATMKLTALAVPGITAAAIAAERTAGGNANFCDANAGAAFQVRQIAGAMVLPSGFNETFLSDPALIATPPIPNAYPSGPLIMNFPTKDITRPASLGQPQFTADITQLVVSALQANVTTLKFTITGTNEPPSRKDAPILPQSDCKAIFSLAVDVRSA